MIALVAAMDVELNILKSSLKNTEEISINGQVFYKALLEEKEVVLTKLGIGKVNASFVMTLLLSNFKVDYVINTGIAGGLSPLNINDIVVSNKLYFADVDVTAFKYQYGEIPGEKKYYSTNNDLLNTVKSLDETLIVADFCTQDKFTTSIEQIKEILKVNTEIKVVDMESTVVSTICDKFNTDFIIVRSISDILDDKNQLETYSEENSAKKVQEFILKMLKTV